MRETGDLAVLFGEAFERIDHDDTDVRPFDGHLGPDDAVLLDAFIDARLPAETGGVDEQEGTVFVFDEGIGRVPGGAGDARDDGPLFPAQGVDERGFAHVGLADDGDLDDEVFLFGAGICGQMLQDSIQ